MCISNAGFRKGKEHLNWKGDEVGKIALHQYMRKLVPKPIHSGRMYPFCRKEENPMQYRGKELK
ncbi:MAG: hypothetical protein WBF33_04780 [Candidatus Nitrosopolaris sp.]